jgi:predicted nucleic acid-binding protein
MSFLIDTDICSAHLKTNTLTHRFLQHLGRLHVSTITLAELFTWALRAKASPSRLQALNDLLTDVLVLDVTSDVAKKFGEIHAGLLDTGQGAPGMDLLIASTAIVHGLTLVTHNVKDYSNIPGLNLVDWMAP